MEEQTQISEQPAQPAASAPNGKKVLCIEDEYFITELYERALTRAGYEVRTIIDGPSGLEEARTDQYDIILLDIMLPNMSGLEVLKALRSPEVPNPIKAKIIITTNLDQGEEGRKAVENQADGYIVKAEITPRQLVEFLQQLAI